MEYTSVREGFFTSHRFDSPLFLESDDPLKISDPFLPLQHRNKFKIWLEDLQEHYTGVSINPFWPLPLKASVKISHTYPIHFAAGEGDIAALSEFIKLGYNINARDNLNSTPLHVAVVSNQKEAVQILIDHGAQLNASAYYDWRPLSIAFYKEHLEIALILLAQPHIKIYDEDIYSLISNFWDFVLDHQDKSFTPSDSEQFNLYLKVFEKAAYLVDPAIVNYNEYFFEVDDIPLTVILTFLATLLPDRLAREELVCLAQRINQFDHSEEKYIQTKFMTHVLEMSGDYTINYERHNGEGFSLGRLMGEAGFSYFILKGGYGYFERYTQNLSNNDWVKKNAFENIKPIFYQAVDTNMAMHDKAVIQNLYDEISQGGRVVLPTGWEEHFVVQIIDGKNDLFVVSNTGERFYGNDPGSIIYKMHHPENLTPQLIEDILNNPFQFSLEYDLYYQLGLEKLMVLPEPDQVTGNCSWRSMAVAVEALLFLELNDLGMDRETSLELAHRWYQEWHETTRHEVLNDALMQDSYGATGYSVPDKGGSWFNFFASTQKPENILFDEVVTLEKAAFSQEDGLFLSPEFDANNPYESALDSIFSPVISDYGAEEHYQPCLLTEF